MMTGFTLQVFNSSSHHNFRPGTMVRFKYHCYDEQETSYAASLRSRKMTSEQSAI